MSDGGGYNSNYGGGGSNGEMSAQKEEAMRRATEREKARRDKIIANIRAKNPFYAGQIVSWDEGVGRNYIGEYVRLLDGGTLAELRVLESPTPYVEAGAIVPVDIRSLKRAKQPTNRLMNLRQKREALGNVLNVGVGEVNHSYGPSQRIANFAGLGKLPKGVTIPSGQSSLRWKREPSHLNRIGNVFNAIENTPKPSPGGGALGPNNVARRKRKTRRNTRRNTRKGTRHNGK